MKRTSHSIQQSRQVAIKQETDPYQTILESAVLMMDCLAGILVISEQQSHQHLKQHAIVAHGITMTDARGLSNWLLESLAQQEATSYHTIAVPYERWPQSITQVGGANDGEAVAISIPLNGQIQAWLFLLGTAGILRRQPMSTPRTQTALLSMLTMQLQTTIHMQSIEERYTLLESTFLFSGDGILTVDAELRITSCNPALERLIVWQAKDMLGKFYYDILRPEDFQHQPLGLSRCPLVEAFATNSTISAREMIIQTHDGQRVETAVTANIIRSAEGLPISGVLNIRDVSHQRQHEMLSSTIISVVSHELQTPIAIIKGYAATLSRPDAHWSEEILRKRLVAIEEEADRLHHMVSNILYASRIQAGKLTMQLTALDVRDLLEVSIRRLRARHPQHQFRLRVPANLPVVTADRERIEEVITNLVDNAAKYSPHQTTIVLQAWFTSDEVLTSVADAGAGISQRDQQRVFERFQRVEGDLTRNTQGAGLGLFICQSIVQAHGGTIRVESEVGKGSTFSFSLPRIERAQVPMIRPYTSKE